MKITGIHAEPPGLGLRRRWGRTKARLTVVLGRRLFASAIAFALAAGIGGWPVAPSHAQAAGPDWRIGRAVIEAKRGSGQQQWLIKVSLRNRGAPGREPVAFLARWAGPETEGARAGGRAAPPARYTRLAHYVREVALRRTVILEVPLRPLGPIPRHRPPIELVVRTGERTSDRQIVKLPRP